MSEELRIPVLPEWKLLSYEELKKHIQPRNEIEEALLELVKQKKIRAWLRPDGEIVFQYSPVER